MSGPTALRTARVISTPFRSPVGEMLCPCWRGATSSNSKNGSILMAVCPSATVSKAARAYASGVFPWLNHPFE